MKSVEDLREELESFILSGVKPDPEEWLLVVDKEKVLEYGYVYDDYVYLHVKTKQYFYVQNVKYLMEDNLYPYVVFVHLATPVEKTIIDYEF